MSKRAATADSRCLIRASTEERSFGDDMSKLQQGDRLPSITLKVIGGDTLTLPEQMPSRYLALLFYRAHW